MRRPAILWCLVLSGLAGTSAAAQDAPVRPQLTHARLWSPVAPRVRVSPMLAPAQDPQGPSPLITALVAGVGSLGGIWVGTIVGGTTADSYNELAATALVGSWVGGAAGASMVGSDLRRSMLGSALGVALGLLAGQIESSGWGYVSVHALTTGIVGSR